MFTIEEINDIHDRLGKAETFLEYVEALSDLGVTCYESYVTDGHSEYFGKNDYTIKSPAIHDIFNIAETSNQEEFERHLDLHVQGKTSYLEMSQGLADSGVEKWTVDADKCTMTFYDKAGKKMLVEDIE